MKKEMRKMSRHTPGKWNDEGFTVQLEDRTIIADCCVTNPISGSPPAKEYRANARLIAAAPVMLEALQAQEDADRARYWAAGADTYAANERYRRAQIHADELRHAAIAQATGEEVTP